MSPGWAQGLERAIASADGLSLGFASLGLLGAGVVKGATGLGFATCALPFLVPIVGLKEAMALVLTPAIATNVSVAIGAGHLTEILKRFALFYIASIPGIVCGALLLTVIDAEWAGRLLGLSILAYSYVALAKPVMIMPPAISRLLQGPAGFCTGALAGLTGSQVMPLLPYMMAVGLDTARLVQAINLSVLVCSIALGATMVAGGGFTEPVLLASVLALPVSLLGVFIGGHLRVLLPGDVVRKLVLLVLLGMGLSLAAR